MKRAARPIRAFIAIELPPNIVAELEKLQDSLRSIVPDRVLRWVRPGQIHLTLTFLGNIAAQDVAEVAAAMRYALRGLASAMLTAAMSREIERLGLGSVQHRLIGNLSRGYRQRVGLAQALIHDPSVLILDEPTVGLDPKQIIEIRELIKSLAGSHSVILSTHILPEATAVCQRVVIISGGRIVAEDTPDRLSARLRHSEKIALTLTRPAADAEARLRLVDGVLHVHGNGPAGHFLLESQLGRDIREEVARVAVTNNWGLVELKLISMTLEDVFLKLTRDEEGLAQHSDPATVPGVAGKPDTMDVPS